MAKIDEKQGIKFVINEITLFIFFFNQNLQLYKYNMLLQIITH